VGGERDHHCAIPAPQRYPPLDQPGPEQVGPAKGMTGKIGICILKIHTK